MPGLDRLKTLTTFGELSAWHILLKPVGFRLLLALVKKALLDA